MNPELSIIIVNYNTADFMDKCLASIFNSSEALSREVIVVDNNSSDGSSTLVKSKYPQARLIENRLNLGFAGANNIGARNSSGDTIIFLNPDTIVTSGQFSKLAAILKSSPDAGIVAPRLVNPDGTLQYSCRRFYNLRTVFFRRLLAGSKTGRALSEAHLMKDWDHNSTKAVDWVLAACLAIKRDTFNQIGGFDDKYMLYFEDVDLCKRIYSIGKKVYYYPEAVVTHHYQRESANRFNKRTYWHIKSAFRFFSKFGWKF
ncbi:MAG: hypothetical protein A2204_03190 [Elusimicrobia bacterium RIFOXYA1_FULL_47_7]|nr:MAG: hypothetical protein A2278_01705 [Elusimicrobia bacterium RIFOXYA12_FULL_49_49]OGS09065.1 MAG: hypothetical protein A2204_03190 [Elusimicrobia bacterium RIFOXYA1_FULL_47_7]OGS11655.1 MAG: hypothetical protein A2386_03250 [Elusimicrobia bacterium RIFOXYB1_FULL_48_9]OGS16764.1 MAG: hypothetical protein A2251_05155 [Elusimicrobia bacterium RIFOXYA2_FULL_47_53]OGS27045.1 MAG: hypothetical protein A2339_05010 [Elusimicrobia bacterium RIFOXYB12_FULL_50_12]OGS31992.1 MAG: hypothetical protein